MKIAEYLNILQNNAEDLLISSNNLLVKYEKGAKRLKKFEGLIVASYTVLFIECAIIFITFFIKYFFNFNLFLNPNIRIEYLYLILLPQVIIIIIFDKKYKKLNEYLNKAKYYNNFAGRILKAVFNARQKYKEIEENNN